MLTDDADEHEALPRGARPLRPRDHTADAGRDEHFWDWRNGGRITTGAIRLTDYNFKTPGAAMELEQADHGPHELGDIESFDWPGLYVDPDEGRDMVQRRLAEERGQASRHRAEGAVPELVAGRVVTLDAPGRKAVDGKAYLCLVAQHAYAAEAYGSATEGGGGQGYTGRYVLQPATEPLRPERKTPPARVHGPQTAVVVGEGEIDCDEYGRILVQFHWDLDAAWSMRCRVSQNWAGKGWGGMVIPRIGMEVVVEFLDGDPDRPLVTGCVYNGRNDTPYELPAHKTRSTFKTDTHQGTGFNELRFEDEKGREEIYLHAERDRNTKVENNQSERVNVNKVESIGHNKASEIGNNLLQVVDGDMALRVGLGNVGSVTPSGASAATEGLPTLAESLGTAGSAPAGEGMLAISVDRSKSQTIGENHTEFVEENKTSEVGKAYRLEAGTAVLIEAGDRISLVCGKSTITLNDNGTITINGRKIMQLGDDLIRLQADVVKIN